ncbi:transcriptional regulator [Anaerosacchariphilus polymeriproducens]|uniref:Transcriptional regulator n=1 Tax=Anaerosacchariphilus polymeriproducens TaxID=1812858 RepID=A0A371AXA4_9FIRM|nr:transcriptional regulator [Anaerosacchariphilus polymeriproducens]RDU24203.1 transcriptional regulator [Anaerosacchariphilus polymeriproducens]
MIKRSEFFRKKRYIAIITGVLCFSVLCGILLTKAKNIGNKEITTTEANTKNLEKAVSQAIKEEGKDYLEGEYITEGHTILGTEKNKNKIKVYSLASVGYFGFENGIFTDISGSGAIPTVMIFEKKKDGTYLLKEYKEPADGSDQEESIKELFPEKYYDKVLALNDEYSVLAKQQETQAAQYLKSIGRKAEVRVSYVDKQLPSINTEASNKLFAEYMNNDSFLMTCPYWLGTREEIEDDIRYIYETSQSKTEDGYDLITFQKKTEDNTVVEKRSYKIVGSEPMLL